MIPMLRSVIPAKIVRFAADSNMLQRFSAAVLHCVYLLPQIRFPMLQPVYSESAF
jgi:hypothetical protein